MLFLALISLPYAGKPMWSRGMLRVCRAREIAWPQAVYIVHLASSMFCPVNLCVPPHRHFQPRYVQHVLLPCLASCQLNHASEGLSVVLGRPLLARCDWCSGCHIAPFRCRSFQVPQLWGASSAVQLIVDQTSQPSCHCIALWALPIYRCVATPHGFVSGMASTES